VILWPLHVLRLHLKTSHIETRVHYFCRQFSRASRASKRPPPQPTARSRTSRPSNRVDVANTTIDNSAALALAFTRFVTHTRARDRPARAAGAAGAAADQPARATGSASTTARSPNPRLWWHCSPRARRIRPLRYLRTPWLLCAECVIGGAKRFRSKSFAGRGSDPSGSDRTDPALKMPVGEAICLLQLVDKTVLEGMGPPTVGFDARSELPTDPHGPSGASGGRTSVATRIS
jgi:hypothetical protein